MKRKRYTSEQIIRKLKTVAQLLAQSYTAAHACRVLEVSQPQRSSAATTGPNSTASQKPCGFARVLKRWSENSVTTTAYIEPGSPWQNGFAELFTTVAEAQALADCWRWEYNNLRPHSALQGHTPLEAAQPVAA